MPTLILPPRYTTDSIALWKAAISMGWDVQRLQNWSVPDSLKDQEVAVYGEPLFAAHVAEVLSLALIEPPFDWLVNVPQHYLHRSIRYATLADARQQTKPAFIKPADDKCFVAKVYNSSAELPQADFLPPSTPVLIADPVQ